MNRAADALESAVAAAQRDWTDTLAIVALPGAVGYLAYHLTSWAIIGLRIVR